MQHLQQVLEIPHLAASGMLLVIEQSGTGLLGAITYHVTKAKIGMPLEAAAKASSMLFCDVRQSKLRGACTGQPLHKQTSIDHNLGVFQDHQNQNRIPGNI